MESIHPPSSLPLNLAKLSSSNVAPSGFETLQLRQLIQLEDETVSRLDEEISQAVARVVRLSGCRDSHRRDVDALCGIASPLGRFPPEILAEIFLICMEASRGIKASTSISGPPLVFGRVCSSWRAVSIATPRLWCDIELRSLMHSDTVPLIQLFVDRSRPLPLYFDVATEPLLGTRLQHLNLRLAIVDLEPLVVLSGSMFSALQKLALNIHPDYSCPQRAFVGTITIFAAAPIKSFTLVSSCLGVTFNPLLNLHIPWARLQNLHLDFFHDPLVARAILSQCFDLEVCSIAGTESSYFRSPTSTSHARVLPRLRTLAYTGTYREDERELQLLLESCSFPQLRFLELNTFSWSGVPLALCVRSGFALEELTLGHVHLPVDAFVAFLEEIPTLKRLIIGQRTRVDCGFLDALTYSADSHSAILPRLEFLTIWSELQFDPTLMADMFESRWWPEPVADGSNVLRPLTRLKRAELYVDFERLWYPDVERLYALAIAGILCSSWEGTDRFLSYRS
ncbi:hypothetical protein B0H16DRAFT_120809 [Mycena metata]|uniref:F-box domain-containing protein n=1 Tax=Mycena metata TaxID=1033252 RepID=A0AAD7I874_9AGAR|nr:hypothetical protein B0H16DRAFT_120809 [Mycena metata]